MNRRAFLGGAGSGLVFSLGGCVGSMDPSASGPPGDQGQRPEASLRMNAITDVEIAREVTFDISEEHRTEKRELATDVIENGSATATGEHPPFPESTPFIYDSSIYELSFEIAESAPATSFVITIDPDVDDISDDERIAFDDLPEVDKGRLEQQSWWRDPPTFAVETGGFTYRDDELPASVLVPEPEYPVISWDSDTHARVTIEGSSDTTLHTYEYSATQIHESAAQFGRSIREEHEFSLSDLSDDQEATVSEAISSENGYRVPPGESLPKELETLMDQFAREEEVTRVYSETSARAKETPITGWYIIDYEGEVYWTELTLLDDLPGSPDS